MQEGIVNVRRRLVTRVPGLAAAGLALLIAPALRASTIGIIGQITASGSATYGTPYNDSFNAPGAGPLSFSQTVSGSASGCNDYPFPNGCDFPITASSSETGLLAGNQLSLSGNVAVTPGSAGDLGSATGGLTAYDTITFQPGLYLLTEFVTSAVNPSASCGPGNESTSAQVYVGSGYFATPQINDICGNADGTVEKQAEYTFASTTTDTLQIYAQEKVDPYPGETSSASVEVTAYLDALSGSYTAVSQTNYSSIPEPAAGALVAGGLMLAAVLRRRL
jgi:hypothetical protein